MNKKLHLKLMISSCIALSLIATSCKKDAPKNAEQPETPIKNKLETRDAGDNLYDVLGFGYDITGEYASSTSTGYRVIDMVKLVQTEPLRYVTDNNVTQYGDYHAGGDAVEYLHDLASSNTSTVGIPGIFSSSFTNNFHESSHVSSKYSYASATMMIRQKHLRFDAPISLIKSTYLTSSFKADVINLTPQQLVTKYGTHVLTDIILGAKLNVYYRSQTTSSNRGMGAKAGASVNGLGKVFNFSTDASNSYKDSTIQSNYDQHIYYSTVGGDGTKGLFGEFTLDNSAPKVSIANWQSSCTRENAAFIQLGSTDGSLILLSDLIDDPAKKQAVKTYIDQYIASKQIALTDILATVRSSSFYNVFLRLDGRNYVANGEGAGGIVNAQYSAGPWEKMLFTKQTDGTYLIESNSFPGLYLRMDGRNVPVNAGVDYGGKVNLTTNTDGWQRFKILKQTDGTYALQSTTTSFAKVYLRLDGTGVTSFNNGSGGGVVNCAKNTTVPGGWEKFVITPALF